MGTTEGSICEGKGQNKHLDYGSLNVDSRPHANYFLFKKCKKVKVTKLKISQQYEMIRYKYS